MIAGATRLGAQAMKFLGRQAGKVPGIHPEQVGNMVSGAAGLGKKIGGKINQYGQQQIAQGAPSMMQALGQSAPGGLVSALGSTLMTGNPLVGLAAGGLDVAGSAAAAKYGTQAMLGAGNPTLAAFAPAARAVGIYGTSIAAPIAVESAYAAINPQRHVIEQQMAQRPHSQMAGYAPHTMYQTQGMPY